MPEEIFNTGTLYKVYELLAKEERGKLTLLEIIELEQLLDTLETHGYEVDDPSSQYYLKKVAHTSSGGDRKA